MSCIIVNKKIIKQLAQLLLYDSYAKTLEIKLVKMVKMVNFTYFIALYFHLPVISDSEVVWNNNCFGNL